MVLIVDPPPYTTESEPAVAQEERELAEALRPIGVRFSWHYLNVFRVQNPPFALSLSKGFDKLSPNGDCVR